MRRRDLIRLIMYNLRDMKTQIIRIEAYDNLISLLDKITLADTPRLILEDTEAFDWLAERNALLRLHRKSTELGKQIGMISANPQTRLICEEVDVQVFEDISSAQHDRWNVTSPIRFNRSDRSPLTRLTPKPATNPLLEITKPVKILLGGLFLLALVGILIMVIPSSRVILTLEQMSTPVEIPFQISAAFTDMTMTGNIPARIHTETISLARTNPATETAVIPQDFAQGTVIFTNMTDITQNIPIGTMVSTAGEMPVHFTVTEEGILEGRIGSEIVIKAKASEAGETGNVDSGAIRQINSLLGTQLSVRNESAFKGGLSREVNSPGALDRNAIRAEVMTEIKQLTIGKISEASDPDQHLVELSFQIADTVSEEYYPEVGQPGNTISLDTTVTTQILLVSRKVLADYFNRVNAPGLSPGQVLIPMEGEELSLECKGAGSNQIYACVLQGNKLTVRSINSREVQSMLTGQPVSQAETILRSHYPELNSAVIEIDPKSWPWLPFLASRIQVEVR